MLMHAEKNLVQFTAQTRSGIQHGGTGCQILLRY